MRFLGGMRFLVTTGTLRRLPFRCGYISSLSIYSSHWDTSSLEHEDDGGIRKYVPDKVLDHDGTHIHSLIVIRFRFSSL